MWHEAGARLLALGLKEEREVENCWLLVCSLTRVCCCTRLPLPSSFAYDQSPSLATHLVLLLTWRLACVSLVRSVCEGASVSLLELVCR